MVLELSCRTRVQEAMALVKAGKIVDGWTGCGLIFCSHFSVNIKCTES